jgi:hypothetical protein
MNHGKVRKEKNVPVPCIVLKCWCFLLRAEDGGQGINTGKYRIAIFDQEKMNFF